MRFDDVLQYIGEFGPYQKRIYILVSIPILFSAFHKLGWVFLGAVPPHRCMVNYDNITNQTVGYHLPEEVFNASIPWDEKNQQWSRCEMYTSFSENQSQKMTEKCHRWVYDDSQYVSTVVTEFDLVCDRNWLRALVHSLYLVGEFLGSTALGMVADRIGRKKILFYSLLGQGIFGISAGLFHNYYSFIILRTFVGMFTQEIILAAFVLGLEFVGPSKRTIAGTACNYFFAIGYISTAGLAYAFNQWTYLHISLSVPALLYIIVLRWVPESARWLISQKRYDEAMAIIRKAAKLNKKSVPEAVLKHEPSPTVQMRAIDLFWKPAVRVRVLIMCFAWFVNSAVYYGLSLNTSNLGGNDYLNFLIAALLEFPAYTICIVATTKYGRRVPLCMSMVFGGLALLSTLLVPVEMKIITITLAMVGKFGITISYAIIFVFAAEVYPTQVRNIALGVNSTCARLGAMVTSFIVLLGDYWRPLPLIILGAMSLSSGLLTLFLPETHRKALPENFADASQLMTAKENLPNLRKESKVYSADGIEMSQANKTLLTSHT